MTEKLKDSESEIKQRFIQLFELYNAAELEDTLFEIFNEDLKREHLFASEREKKAIIHDALRSILRIIQRNPKILKQLQ